jgi:hypothetical protein
MTELLGPAAIGVPSPINPIPIAEKDIDREPTSRWSADVLAE